MDSQSSSDGKGASGLRAGAPVRTIGGGEDSALSRVRGSLREIEGRDADVHAWVELSARAEQDARERDAQDPPGPLHGMPVGVKDLIDVAGLPTRCGSVTTSEAPVRRSADCVRRLEELGAVVVGKTVTTEFGYFSPGPSHNPAAPGHTPGGSSSGSAAAVAAGMVPLALGTQTAGSLTRPASYCGVAGMVLAHGSTSLDGVAGLSPSLDSLGMLAPTVDDLAHVFAAFSGIAPEASPPGLIEVWDANELQGLDPQMTALVRHVADRLREDDVRVRDLDWTDHVLTLAADHQDIMSYEAARTRGPLDAELAPDISPEFVALIDRGRAIPDREVQAARVRCERSGHDLRTRLGGHGVIIGAAAPGPAPAGRAATGNPVLSRPWQALGMVAVTVPGGRTSAGLPLGIQVLGHPGHEGTVLHVARTVERLLSPPDPGPARQGR